MHVCNAQLSNLSAAISIILMTQILPCLRMLSVRVTVKMEVTKRIFREYTQDGAHAVFKFNLF